MSTESQLFTWATTARVNNSQRATPCSVRDAFLHSEGTVTFDLKNSRAPFCLLHARYLDAYRYVPRSRVEALLEQAAAAREHWTTRLIIYKGQPPQEPWVEYQGILRYLASEVAAVLRDLSTALPVVEPATVDELSALIVELKMVLGEHLLAK